MASTPTRKNTLTAYRRHKTACDKTEPTYYPSTPRERKDDTCVCPINVHGYLQHHIDAYGKQVRIRHYSLDTPDWIEAHERSGKLLKAGRLLGSIDPNTQPSGTVTVKFAVDAFLKRKSEGTSKVADATMDTYDGLCHGRLLPWCQTNGVTLIHAFDNLDTTERFDQSWKNLRFPTQDLGGDSRKTTMTIFRVFLNYCVERGWLKTNTARKINPTKAQQRHSVKNKKYGLELHDYENVLRYMDATGTEPRIKTMIELMRWTGMRVSDATKFEASELVRNGRNDGWNADFIAQKNGKECRVPLPNDVAGMLKALPFLHERFWFRIEQPSLRKQTQKCGEQIAAILRATQKMFGTFAHPATAHTLRHTFSIQSLNNGVRVETVAAYLGDDLATVLRYYSHAIRSTQEMQEDAGRQSIETTLQKLKAIKAANDVNRKHS